MTASNMTDGNERPPVIEVTEEVNTMREQIKTAREMIAAGIPAACAAWLAAHPEWAPIPGFSRYEVSHRGGGVRRIGSGQPLKVSIGTHGYPQTGPYRDGKQDKRPMHSFVLLGHAGPPPEGQEALHGRPCDGPSAPADPLDYRYCGCGSPDCTEGNLRYDTHKVNVGETIAAGKAVRPATHPCINHERCGGMVVNRGSRCLPCAQGAGRAAAAMRDAGIDLPTATRRLGYKSQSWVLGLSMRYGGDGGEAWVMQRQRWPRRALATLRYRLRGDGK
jgi:hypothetical protein